MLTLEGKVLGVYRTPEGTKDGKSYGGKSKVDLLGTSYLRNGEVKHGLVSLGVDEPDLFRGLVDQFVAVPVGLAVFGGQAVLIHERGSPKPVVTVERAGV